MTGAGLFAYRRRHAADRARARNQDIFAEQIELQRRVHCVAEGVEQGSDIEVDAGTVLPDVGHGKNQEFGEGARPVDADPAGVGAQVPPAGHAVATAATNDVAFSGHDFSRMEVIDIIAHGDDFADKLVTDDHRHGNGFLRPGIPIVDMQVGAADGGTQNLDENVVDAKFRYGHIFQPQAFGGFLFHQRLHRFHARSSP